MKTSTVTIRLDAALGRELDQACARTGRTRSDLARDALRRPLALLRFERAALNLDGSWESGHLIAPSSPPSAPALA